MHSQLADDLGKLQLYNLGLQGFNGVLEPGLFGKQIQDLCFGETHRSLS